MGNQGTADIRDQVCQDTLVIQVQGIADTVDSAERERVAIQDSVLQAVTRDLVLYPGIRGSAGQVQADFRVIAALLERPQQVDLAGIQGRQVILGIQQ